ncbi:ABC transporter permease [Streptomyces jeddahensis]|uniref:Putative D,D-dipeptide transport system permease protein DdpC n=1 Tax=Streptomyces jeddahensis TaxID=1716141 RepID=A0A177HM95_9ACTN|nr:ABC transporter permease [Streptomyces jeddahensis]OAH11739.1 putative D,D-dipeptide transport system permease protein DdpC [Streptomyces jeddahensis]
MSKLTTAAQDATPSADPAPGAPRPYRFPKPVRRASTALATVVLVMILGWAFLPEMFATHDPVAGVPTEKLQPPGEEHWFGTDNLGRDIYSRVVHGSALSLQAALIAVLVASTAGSLIGLLAGYLRGWVDDVLMRMVDVAIAVPGMVLSLAIVTALGFGTVNVAVAVGLAGVTTFARVMRAEVLRVTTAQYVEAAVVCGVRRWAVLARHVLPNALGPVVVLAALEFGTAILSVSALSFLGFGAAPPTPEWGNIISEGRNYLATAGWMTTLPGAIVVVVVLAANRFARILERPVRSEQ